MVIGDKNMATNKESGVEYVTIHTIHGAIGLGKIDKQGRLIWRSGKWIPVPENERDVRDRILRRDVKEIIRDGGREYKETLKNLMLPPTYTQEMV